MSVFHTFELLDPKWRESVFTRPRSSSSFHFPLAHALVSAGDYLEFDKFYPTFSPLDLHPDHHHRRHHYHHQHQYRPFPLSLPFPYLFDLIVHNHAGAELYAGGLGDRLSTLELGIDRDIGPCIDTSESKWKGTAEIKGKERERFGLKCKCTTETSGAFKKSMRWTVEYQGKGKYTPLRRMYTLHADHAASVSTHDVSERAKKEKKGKRAMTIPVKIHEEADQQVVSQRQASAKRTVNRSKGKTKELSAQDAAMAIQKAFRDHLWRRSQALHSLRDLAAAKSMLKEIRASFSSFSYRYRISKVAGERQRFSEKIIILLLTLDAVEGQDYLVRSAKSSMTRELEALLEVVDPQPYGRSGSRRRKFDLPAAAGSFSSEIASGVADVVRMLDQEDDCSPQDFPLPDEFVAS